MLWSVLCIQWVQINEHARQITAAINKEIKTHTSREKILHRRVVKWKHCLHHINSISKCNHYASLASWQNVCGPSIVARSMLANMRNFSCRAEGFVSLLIYCLARDAIWFLIMAHSKGIDSMGKYLAWNSSHSCQSVANCTEQKRAASWKKPDLVGKKKSKVNIESLLRVSMGVSVPVARAQITVKSPALVSE